MYLTSVTEPRPGRDVIEAHTIRVRRDIAAIAKKQQLLVVRIAAYHTRLEIDQVIIVHEFDDHRRVDIGYLDSVLDGIGRNDGA